MTHGTILVMPPPNRIGQEQVMVKIGYSTESGAVVIEKTELRKNNSVLWKLTCSCGKEFLKTSQSIKNNKRLVCNDCVYMLGSGKFKNLAGQKFGRYLVLDKWIRAKNCTKWYCECECGEKRYVVTSSLTRGKTFSCGCYARDNASKRQSLVDKHKDITGKIINNNCEVMERAELGKDGCKRRKIKCHCGKIFIVHEGSVVANKVNGCSKCVKSHLRTKFKRKNKQKRDRKYDRPIISRIVKKRRLHKDNYTCQICKKVGGVLNVHHLEGWNWNIEKRFDINNCITLCSGKNSCHNKFHSLYGQGDNTQEQFEQFLLFCGHLELLKRIRNDY